jgi:hypothetical protein
VTRNGMADLPLRAAYSIGELAGAARIERRRLARILEQAGVTFLMSGRVRLVSLSELERKVPPLWEGIKAAYTLAGGQ